MQYRPSVGMMVISPAGKVFVGRRIDRGEVEEVWQMPQGGVDHGEDLRGAALRELEEEIGTRKVEIIGETQGWLQYDLPDELLGKALHGKYRGQRQRWFAMRFRGEDRDINVETGHPEFDSWKWVDPNELLSLIVPFKRDVYREVLRQLGSLVTRADEKRTK
jgi:putative (di)nucleoside polyphosphate hydrolase